MGSQALRRPGRAGVSSAVLVAVLALLLPRIASAAGTGDGSGGQPPRETAPRERPAGPDAGGETAAQGEAPSQDPVAAFGDVVQVSLATFVVRVVDASGDAVTGLGPENFLVTTGDERVPVVAVDWISSRQGAAPEPVGKSGEDVPAGGAAPEASTPPGTWIVLFVQADFNALRIRGHLKFLPFVERLLEALPAGDRVALVSFDSHLKLWKDFTTDRRAVADAVFQAMRFSNRPEPGEVAAGADEAGSLAAHWDGEAARDAAYVEDGLRRVAEALEPLPGDKVVVFLGWGMGRYGAGGVRPRRGHYEPAVEALGRAGASVYVLDVSDAAYHSLEVGLRRVAADTGGTYQKTVEFPQQALDRLTQLLRGYYLVTVDADALAVGDLNVQLQGMESGVRALIRPLRAVP